MYTIMKLKNYAKSTQKCCCTRAYKKMWKTLSTSNFAYIIHMNVFLYMASMRGIATLAKNPTFYIN